MATMEAETMSSISEDYYVVIRCSNRNKESCFARLREFLLSVITRLLYSLRKRFSKIVINGKPLCKEPEDLPRDTRRLSHKQLKKIKEALAKLDLGNQTNPGSSQGLLAPPTTPRSTDDEIEIEVVYAGEIGTTEEEEDKPTDYTERSGVHVQLESQCVDTCVNEVKKVNRKPRPKAAKGRRSETAIPPYMLIDEDAVTENNTRKRKRPKAAKGKRKVCVEHPVDLAPDILVASFKNDGCIPERRQRPQTPRPRSKFEAKEDDIDFKINEILKVMQSPLTKRKAKKNQQKLSTIAETSIAEEQEVEEDLNDDDDDDDDEEEDDIFNVPYLPKSQRKHAHSGLSMPWMK